MRLQCQCVKHASMVRRVHESMPWGRGQLLGPLETKTTGREIHGLVQRKEVPRMNESNGVLQRNIG